MASSRDREAWSYVFKLYKGLPHLWDKNNINYGNRSMMTDGYKILTRVYRKKTNKQASVGALRMKMKNLRTTYYRELRKIKDSREKGEKYTPSLWYFENLNFLGTSKSMESDTVENDEDEEIQELMQIEDYSQVDDFTLENSNIDIDLGPSTSQSKTESQKKNIKIIENEDDDIVKKNLMKYEHWEVIGKSIGYQLRDLSKQQYTIVSKLISDAIYFGRLNKLSEMSHIEIGAAPHTDSHSQSPHYNPYPPSEYCTMRFRGEEVPTKLHQNAPLKLEDEFEEELNKEK